MSMITICDFCEKSIDDKKGQFYIFNTSYYDYGLQGEVREFYGHSHVECIPDEIRNLLKMRGPTHLGTIGPPTSSPSVDPSHGGG